MTTPYRRGSEPGASGNPLEDIFPDFPAPWNGEWILTAGAASTENTEEVLVGRNLTMGASGVMGASGATGSSGTPVTVLNKSSMPSLHQRDQSVVEAVFQGAVPMLGAWEGAADALNRLMGGFNSLEQFIETLFKVLTGAEVDLSFITEGARVFLELLQTVFGPIGEFFTLLWETIGEDIFLAITSFLGWVWNLFSEIAADLGEDVRPILESVTNVVKTLWETFGDVIEAILQPVSEFLKWLFTNFGTVVETFIKPIISWLFGIWGAIGAPLLSDIAAFLASLWNTIGEPALQGIFATLSVLWNTFDEVVIDNLVAFFVALTQGNLLGALEEVGDFFKGIIDSFGSIAAGIPVVSAVENFIKDLIGALTGNVVVQTLAQGIQMIVSWVTNVPVLGPLLSAIIPDEWENPATGQPASSLADLKTFASTIVNEESVLSAYNLQGFIPPDLLPVVSPGFVGDASYNLVADPTFASAAAVEDGSGWSWDSGTTRTAGSGGSVKVVGDGGIKYLFSNLVAVSPGQKLQCEVWAKWTKPSAARPTISVGIRGYEDSTVKFTQAVGSQSSVVPDSTGVAGQVNGWVKLTGTYEIPSNLNLTHVRLALSVLNAPAGTSVWFDEASLQKVSLIGQELVAGVNPGDNLADSLENTIGTTEWQDLLNRVAKKVGGGATIADVQAAIDSFLTGSSNLNGSRINTGDISSAFISELKQTWDKMYEGANGFNPNTGLLESALQALLGQASVSSGQSQKILLMEGRINGLEAAVADLQRKVNATPPPIVRVDDQFNRTSGLGADWSASVTSGGLSTDGFNAVFSAGSNQQASMVWNNAATKSSNTSFQQVYMSLATKPGPVGGPGFNDLIGRAASPLVCVVARFFGSGEIKLFYRSGSWEDYYAPATTFATFNNTSTQLTAGTIIEFFVGDKTASDQARCYVKVGGWTSGYAYIPANALSILGRGWGMGFGSGFNVLGGSPAGKVNFWGAQDQA